MWLITLLAVLGVASVQEDDVRRVFEARCVSCHSGAAPLAGLNLQGSLPVGQRSVATGRFLVVPGEPDESYLVAKIRGAIGIVGSPMPLGMAPLTEEERAVVVAWIEGLPASAPRGERPAPEPAVAEPVFAGDHQIALHTTTTLGRHSLGFRVHHRFGRFGKPRSFGGLDGGAVMSLGLTYGILDGWDVILRRTNSRKDYELGTKVMPLRQEDGAPLSAGVYASIEYLDEPELAANRWVYSAHLLAARRIVDPWAAQLVVAWSSGTNHAPDLVVDRRDGPVVAEDTRGTLGVGAASTVWFDRRRRWGVDGELLWPIPGDGFYYRGGEADALDAVPGHWGLGLTNHIGLHVFQVMLTNNREIHTNLVAPGGQLTRPWADGGNFYVGFNLSRWWKLPRKTRSEP